MLDPSWLTRSLCGHILSQEFTHQARVTGAYAAEEFQLALPQWESADVLPILEAVGITTRVRHGYLHGKPIFYFSVKPNAVPFFGHNPI